MRDRVLEMIDAMLERNAVDPDTIISALFTATPDLHSVFPATVARERLPADVPLMCAQELDTEASLAACIRVMMHIDSDTPRAEIKHAFMQGAAKLRPDLAESADPS